MKDVDVTDAIRNGNFAAVEEYLSTDPGAANERMDGHRTLLHFATDWPGHFPHVRQTIEALASHGADLNAPFIGQHPETPLHWATSSDDLDALDALLDLGANIESPGAVIGGGTPLSDAVGFAQWHAARRLIERGARSALWHEPALGLMERLEERFGGDDKPSDQDVANAFWNACRGGQLEAAKYLLNRGADLNWVGHGGSTPLDVAVQNENNELQAWLRERGAHGAKG